MIAAFNTPPEASPSRRRTFWAIAAGLVLWTGLIGGLAYLLYARSYWLRESDEANLREWLDEGRVFRKSLPDLVSEYLEVRGSAGPTADDRAVRKREEIAEQLKRLVEPTRLYTGQIPLFPDIYRLEITFPATDWDPIAWDSPMPRPLQPAGGISVLTYSVLGEADRRAWLRCEYRLHAYNVRQQAAEQAQRQLLAVVALVFGAGLPAVGWTYWVLQRERRREIDRVRAEQKAEHLQKLALEETLGRREAEMTRDELDRKLLEQRLEAARQESRAAEAERSTLELRSQLYASIGIMAGSYAHNIKNLLVRPNDLLARCLESGALDGKPESEMIGEIRQTLGTVTERLQQILRTVRRDPSRTETIRFDLNAMVRSLLVTWQDLAREKWKLALTGDLAATPLLIEADQSHLLQAIENLLFNARDATFEMRNHRRETARQDRTLDDAALRAALIDAAAWKGHVTLRTRSEDGSVLLEVIDNGIGMDAEVRAKCTETHFSTKRDNALYEGYSAGMGLGLSFVVVILEHHGAKLEIESEPYRGTTFRVRFRKASTADSTGADRELKDILQ